MFINVEDIHNIAIVSTQHSVDFEQFKHFIIKSPFVRRVAFIGPKVFDMPQFPEMVRFCAENDVYLIFGEVCETSTENLRALVEYKNVILINIHEDKNNVKQLQEYKQQFHSDSPEINLIVTEKHTPQEEISNNSYAFFNLADDMENIACLNLLREPLLDYNGDLLGCWSNPDKKHPINAFKLGMDKAFNKPQISDMLKMLKTGKICKSCPCTRCPIFASLVWTNKNIDLCKAVFDED